VGCGSTSSTRNPDRAHGTSPDPEPASLRRGSRGDPNRVSVVLLVRYGEGALLLTGDAYDDVEVALLPHLPRLTLLKAGHHGSRTSTSRALLDATSPELAIISAGDGNRYGHPHDEVLERLDAAGSQVYRTDRDGTMRIRIRRDGGWDIRTSR
jgi:competence protein ComEC